MDLPIGYQTFHKQRFFNYQLNRLHALGYARRADIEQAASQIKTRADYVRVFSRLAETAEADGRLQNAAFYLRAAEFFAERGSDQHKALYRAFHDRFYRAFGHGYLVSEVIPYRGSFLPVSFCRSAAYPARGTILLFGGFDSLIEEFYVIWRTFTDAGYNVIVFEGPGQGGARLLHGVASDHDWEKPVTAVLDHYNLEQVALIGISMGGYWAIRAAAYEPRIQQVVSWSPVYDWLEQVPPFAQWLVRQMVKWEGMMNATVRLRTRLFPILHHAVHQAMYMAKGDQPIDAVHWLLGMNKQHLSSSKVTQDVLLVGGENDAFQPVKLLTKQRDALVNARSVTTRVFTAVEHADMHCQMGNLNLAMGEIAAWLNEQTAD